ncbi:uncharacterized protein LOC122385121 [Amphibalanus amphitrite]|uniref:uncharacterized protein LOC122385121 n=1 Tax=Amphibalanus amphitrite TaxID=1232801 RepID=UPI001C91E958|nr:uncharacterized protein LOC122385121 [Amphibalanus amphitrite]
MKLAILLVGLALVQLCASIPLPGADDKGKDAQAEALEILTGEPGPKNRRRKREALPSSTDDILGVDPLGSCMPPDENQENPSDKYKPDAPPPPPKETCGPVEEDR